eukprot:358141-Chlamydomonas_euryale.AAC.1
MNTAAVAFWAPLCSLRLAPCAPAASRCRFALPRARMCRCHLQTVTPPLTHNRTHGAKPTARPGSAHAPPRARHASLWQCRCTRSARLRRCLRRAQRSGGEPAAARGRNSLHWGPRVAVARPILLFVRSSWLAAPRRDPDRRGVQRLETHEGNGLRTCVCACAAARVAPGRGGGRSGQEGAEEAGG